MSHDSIQRGEQAGPGTPDPREQEQAGQESRSWILRRLDGFLSASQRRGAPLELVRSRVMVASACLMILLTGMGLVLLPVSAFTGLLVFCLLGYLGTLALARRASTPVVPAILLCATMSLGSVASTLTLKEAPYIGIHAGHMLLPAFAVYLLGARRALGIALVLFVGLGIGTPLLQWHVLGNPLVLADTYYLPMQASAGLSLLGAWGLSALHGFARDEARASLERTLKDRRDSENKLLTLIESTDDLIFSVDAEGRLLTANSAWKAAYLVRRGEVPVTGQTIFSPTDPEVTELWKPRLARVLERQHLQFEEEYDLGGKRVTLDLRASPIVGEGGRVTGISVYGRDITARKEAELRLAEIHRTLVDVSRQAGMAEVATGVLHNVGNTLNSVNISAHLVMDELRKMRVPSLVKAIAMLTEHEADLSSFLSADPQGQKLPGFLKVLSERLSAEKEALLKEMRSLIESIEHIKVVVSMQQEHARAVGTVEQLPVPQLIDEALRVHVASFEQQGIRLERDYADVPPIFVDRHKLLQILVNLLTNARNALVEGGGPDKRLRIGVRRSQDERSLLIEVEDNGAGIAAENLPRLFRQGFTTRKAGHGFGLHISALAAEEMGGRLSCLSEGVGRGATFTLELPIVTEEGQQERR